MAQSRYCRTTVIATTVDGRSNSRSTGTVIQMADADDGYYRGIHSTPRWLRRLAGLLPETDAEDNKADTE